VAVNRGRRSVACEITCIEWASFGDEKHTRLASNPAAGRLHRRQRPRILTTLFDISAKVCNCNDNPVCLARTVSTHHRHGPIDFLINSIRNTDIVLLFLSLSDMGEQKCNFSGAVDQKALKRPDVALSRSGDPVIATIGLSSFPGERRQDLEARRTTQ
jgi:hypothetical protein